MPTALSQTHNYSNLSKLMGQHGECAGSPPAYLLQHTVGTRRPQRVKCIGRGKRARQKYHNNSVLLDQPKLIIPTCTRPSRRPRRYLAVAPLIGDQRCYGEAPAR